jgi:SAM-dependent methyltransferase
VTSPSLSSWYTDFFTELPNTFWRAAVDPAQTAAETDFLVRIAGLRPGSRVLDVACGSGRHALELARRGCHVTGVDVSAEAIAYARAAADADGLDVDLRVGDMSDPPAGTPADAAICMGNAFGYLEHDGTRGFLARLAGVLRPGGTLVLDTGFAAESLLPGVQLDEEPMTIGGVTATSVNEYDVVHSRWITRFEFRRGAETHTGTAVQHVYTVAEIGRMVADAGFTDLGRYADTDGGPYRLGSPRLLLVARRR